MHGHFLYFILTAKFVASNAPSSTEALSENPLFAYKPHLNFFVQVIWLLLAEEWLLRPIIHNLPAWRLILDSTQRYAPSSSHVSALPCHFQWQLTLTSPVPTSFLSNNSSNRRGPKWRWLSTLGSRTLRMVWRDRAANRTCKVGRRGIWKQAFSYVYKSLHPLF